MIKRIVLTGGPCAGKTSAIKLIKDYFEKENIIVLFIDECDTKIINNGITPYGENKIDMYDFQKHVFKMQLEEEEKIENYIKENKDKDIIVLYDRCLIDNRSYVSEKQYNKLLKEFNIDIKEYINKFDLFIHLVTAAVDTEYYTLENNNARVESKEDAILLDEKIMKCYKNIPNHKIADNRSNFDDKIKYIIKLIEEI